jgi:hypothetical protein
MRELTAPAVPAAHGFFDECIKGEAEFSLGFMKPNSGFPFGSAGAFGHPGAGGSLGFADPEARIGYAYVPNRKSTTMGGDPRDVALRRALFSATPVARRYHQSINANCRTNSTMKSQYTPINTNAESDSQMRFDRAPKESITTKTLSTIIVRGAARSAPISGATNDAANSSETVNGSMIGV